MAMPEDEDDEMLSSCTNLNFYDMDQRRRLAKRIRKDGHKIVADIGSLYGWMCRALDEYGIKAIATDNSEYFCKTLKADEEFESKVVMCDAFKLPFHNLDALVSHMFLGAFVPLQLRKGDSLAEIFNELSKSSDTIYSVEFKEEYASWFTKSYTEDTEEICLRLKAALPEFNVEYLGMFGKYASDLKDVERIGFKFVKKYEATCS